jgi:16S rRNA (guanine527-N7)-methyltransferase
VEHVAVPEDLPVPAVPAAPAGTRELFGARWPLAEAYVARLAGDGVTRGLIGPRERDRLWDRHVLNCAGVVPLIGAGAAVGDVGSGAGLPGIVIALLRTDVTVDLVEPLLRRTTFLEETVAALGLVQARVIRARAEELVGQRWYDVVTARAVAPLPKLLSVALPLLRPGGELLALKGATAHEELAAAHDAVAQSGAEHAEVITVDAGTQPTWVIRVVSGAQPRSGRR